MDLHASIAFMLLSFIIACFFVKQKTRECVKADLQYGFSVVVQFSAYITHFQS